MKFIVSRNFLNLILMTCFCSILGTTVVQADDNLNIVFTTTDAGGEYGSRHIHVVWLATTSGSFVSTVGTNVGNERAVWAYTRRDSFYTWWTSDRQEDIDARTGATQTAYQTYNINWNFRKLDNSVIPDGTYRLYFECTNSDSGLPRNFTYFTITKGNSTWSMGPTSQGGYNNVTLTYTPAGLGVDNTGATNITSTSARLNGIVTGTEGENPAVYVYWGDNDGGTTAGNWDHLIPLGTMGEVVFYTDISGLSDGQTYYYRCYVEDSSKGVWASSTESFEAVTSTVIFKEGDVWRYFKGYSTPSNWNGLGLTNFDGWFSGPTGIGYADDDDATELTDMEDNYLTVYMRYDFQVDYPGQITSLIFTVDYDDGFVAFINGEEVARSENMPEGQSYNTEANPDHEAGTPEIFDISPYIYTLEAGDNVFAIEVHNTDISSSDLSMIPELVMVGGVQEPQPDISVSPEALEFSLIDVGSWSDLIFSIYNTGPFPLEVQSLEVTGLDKSAYSLVSPPAVPFSIPASTGSQVITTRFEPPSARIYNYASIAIGSDDPNEPVVEVLLSGEGVASPQKSLAISGSVGGSSLAVATKNQYTLLGQGATLTILDTSDPCNPASVGQVRMADLIRQIAVLGDIAYAAGGSSGLMLVGINDPFLPVALNISDTPGYAYDVAVSGSTLCVADGPGGLAFYDISIPNEPVLRGTYLTQGSATAVALSGITAYVLDNQLGLQIIDVAGATGTFLGSYNEIEFGQAIYLSGSLACITDSLGNFYVVDVSNLASPFLRGQTRLAGQGRSIAVMSLPYYDVACVANGEAGTEIVSLEDPNIPLSTSILSTSGQASDLVTSGTKIYVADGSAGLEILNVTDAFEPITELGAYRLQSAPYAAASGSQTYVAAGSAGLHTMDLTIPNSPVMVSVLDSMLEADFLMDDMVNFFDLTLLANNWGATGDLLDGDIYKDNKVDQLDVAKLAADWLSSDTLDEVQGIVISGTTAYLANGRSGFQIVDLSAPTAPSLLGDYATDGPACSVAISGSVAIVADGLGVYVLDIGNSLAPSLIGRWTSDGWAHGVAINGSYGYVANGSRDLQVLSLTDASPVGSYDTPGVAYAVAVSNNVAYVADGLGGIQILNITTATAPALISTYTTSGKATGVTIDGSYLYVAEGSSFTIVDASNPANPSLYATSLVPVRSLSTVIAGSQIIISDDKGGLLIMGIQGPYPGRAGNPNPSNGAIDVSQNVDLNWMAGSDAISHDVYFGTSNPPAFQGNQTATTFDPGTMFAYITYYWRINEINDSGKTIGEVWSFTTKLDPPPPSP